MAGIVVDTTIGNHNGDNRKFKTIVNGMKQSQQRNANCSIAHQDVSKIPEGNNNNNSARSNLTANAINSISHQQGKLVDL